MYYYCIYDDNMIKYYILLLIYKVRVRGRVSYVMLCFVRVHWIVILLCVLLVRRLLFFVVALFEQQQQQLASTMFLSLPSNSRRSSHPACCQTCQAGQPPSAWPASQAGSPPHNHHHKIRHRSGTASPSQRPRHGRNSGAAARGSTPCPGASSR